MEKDFQRLTEGGNMKERNKWILSTIAVITIPIWVLPAAIIGIFYTLARDFKKLVFDKEDKC